MAATQGQPAAFPPGFFEQVMQFLKEQREDGVERLVCYDRDENVAMVIHLPIADPAQAAAQYRQAWQIWRDGGSIIRIRPDLPSGVPDSERRQTISILADFGLQS